MLKAEAKARMAEGGRTKGTEKIPDLGESRDKAAVITGALRAREDGMKSNRSVIFACSGAPRARGRHAGPAIQPDEGAG